MPERTQRSTGLLLWYGVFGGLLAWAAQLVVGYAFEEIACPAGTKTQEIFGASPELLTVLVTVVAGAIAGGAGAASFVRWRAYAGSDRDPRGRLEFMAFVGMLASGLFLLIIVLGGLELVGLDTCVH
jgi:hypothetical protein